MAQTYEPGSFELDRAMFSSTTTLTSANLPTYTSKVSRWSDPGIHLMRNGTEVASTRTHSFSSTTDVIVGGQQFSMRSGTMSSSQTISHPQLGELKWKVGWPGGSADLLDTNGTVLAYMKSGSFSKKFEIYVPCDLALLDMIVVTAMQLKANMEAKRRRRAAAAGGGAGGGGGGGGGG